MLFGVFQQERADYGFLPKLYLPSVLRTMIRAKMNQRDVQSILLALYILNPRDDEDDARTKDDQPPKSLKLRLNPPKRTVPLARWNFWFFQALPTRKQALAVRTSFRKSNMPALWSL